MEHRFFETLETRQLLSGVEHNEYLSNLRFDATSAITVNAVSNSHGAKTIGRTSRGVITATLAASPVTQSSTAGYRFNITYSGYTKAKWHLGDQRVIVTGPNGYSVVARLVTAKTTRSTQVTATYAIRAPHGAWNEAANGTYKVTLQAKLGDKGPRTTVRLGAFNVAINTAPAANQAPSFTAGDNQVVQQDAGAQTVTAWATHISAGPVSESGQTLSFQATTDNDALFAALPAIAPDGTLSYTPATGATGTATVTVALKDSGGTANGGADTSSPVTFTITINSSDPGVFVNRAPSFTAGANQTVTQDAGTQTVAAWATNISPGAASEAEQALNFQVSTNNDALFATAPAIAADGTLSYTPAAGTSGSATVTVLLNDDGGTANGGTDTSSPVTFTITVNPAAPVIPSMVGTYTGRLVIPDVGHNYAATLSIISQDANGAFIGTLVSSFVTLNVTGQVNANGSFTMQLKTPAGTSHPGGPLDGTGSGTLASAGQPMAVSLLLNGAFAGTLTVTKV